MAAFNSLESLLTALDEMDIYQKDYDIIVSLLENTDPKFFTKILEEVLEGNLYWSDFEKVLSPEYEKELRNSLEKQKDLNEHIKRFVTFRRFINSDYDYNYETSNLFLRNNTGIKVEDEFFDQEYKRIRDDILDNLTKERIDDNVVTLAIKIRLYNAIKNGEALLKLTKSEADLSGYEITDVGIKDLTTDEEYEYINPEDIFLFINTYTIPLDYEHQILTDFDKAYMKLHNLDEDTMKHFKALGILLRKKAFFKENS